MDREDHLETIGTMRVLLQAPSTSLPSRRPAAWIGNRAEPRAVLVPADVCRAGSASPSQRGYSHAHSTSRSRKRSSVHTGGLPRAAALEEGRYARERVGGIDVVLSSALASGGGVIRR